LPVTINEIVKSIYPIFGIILVLGYETNFIIIIKTWQRMETNEMKNLLTKFFYKNDHLCYQIMIKDTTSVNIDVYGEYDDFDDYRRTLDGLQNNQIDWTPLRLVQDKTFKTEHTFAKVA
jgi:hypothetical protein